MRKEVIIFLAVLLGIGGMAFAAPSVTFVSPTLANGTWINGTLGQSRITINVTANSSIIVNASSFIQWYNATNASANHSAIAGQTVNSTGGNWTYWVFNLSNDGIHRFDVILLVNTTQPANETSAAVRRYVYYDNTTPTLSLDDPGAGESLLYTGTDGTSNVSINFAGGDATSRDACTFRTDNNTATVLSGCGNTSVLFVYGAHTVNVTINDSAGLSNTAYRTFYVNFSGSGGGGGGGGGTITPEPPLVNENPASVIQQPVGIHSIAGTGPLDSISSGIAGFINSILNVIRGLIGLQPVAVVQPPPPQSIIQPDDRPSGLFGIWKDY